MAKPPPTRGRAVIVVAMARTMDRPRPWPPSRRAGPGPSRWKGWTSRSTSAAGMTCPELVTDRTTPAWLVLVVIWVSPPGMLCGTALSIRLAVSCWTRRGSPPTAAVWMSVWTCRPRRLIAGRAAARAALVMAARSVGSCSPGPASLLARVSSASMRRSCRPDRPGRPGGQPPARLRQPRHLPDRPRPAAPSGVPRHHRRQQHGGPQRGHDHRLPGRTRLGPGHRLGTPDAQVLIPCWPAEAPRDRLAFA
jgi:hypothetical protein